MGKYQKIIVYPIAGVIMVKLVEAVIYHNISLKLFLLIFLSSIVTYFFLFILVPEYRFRRVLAQYPLSIRVIIKNIKSKNS